jgi:hypothetical protein
MALQRASWFHHAWMNVICWEEQRTTAIRFPSTITEQTMATTTQRPERKATPPPAKVEDNTLDEQHAGLPDLTFPVTDIDQSSEGGQSHVASATHDDRERRIARAAYLRAERRGFAPGGELEDWLAAENEENSRGST